LEPSKTTKLKPLLWSVLPWVNKQFHCPSLLLFFFSILFFPTFVSMFFSFPAYVVSSTGYHSTHGKPGSGSEFLADEYVVYKPEQQKLEYIVEFRLKTDPKVFIILSPLLPFSFFSPSLHAATSK
jgi:hypothetical protein